MSDRIVAAIISSAVAVIAGALGYIVAVWRQRRSEKTAERLQEKRGKTEASLKLLDLEFKKINQFLENEGLTDLLRFFEGITPSEVLGHLRNISVLDQHFQEQKEQLGSINRLLDATLFNPVTGCIHRKIESNVLFISRLQKYKESKEYLMDYITGHEIVQDILREKDTIFIESGSTLAYCMLRIIDDIQKYRPDCESRPLRVCTNNIGIYMILLFEKYFEPVLLPGKPDNQYGATFADATGIGPNDGQEVRRFLDVNNVEALFTTASYLDIVYGPHVSSERNHAVKRIFNEYANENECENILVITAEKINDDVTDGNIDENCKLIFDRRCTSIVLTEKTVLDEARYKWEEHLRRSSNIVITGSHSKDLCQSAINAFCNAHPYMRPFPIDFGDGSIVKIYFGGT
jgi:hypothetical protein